MLAFCVYSRELRFLWWHTCHCPSRNHSAWPPFLLSTWWLRGWSRWEFCHKYCYSFHILI